MICSLATSRQPTLAIAVKPNRRLTLDIWLGKPMTAVKSHRSSSNTGRRVPSGNVRPASRQTSAIPHLRRSGRLPCGHRRQKRGVAPCQVRDAYLVTAGLIELLAELVAVAVVEDSLEHLVAGGPER